MFMSMLFPMLALPERTLCTLYGEKDDKLNMGYKSVLLLNSLIISTFVKLVLLLKSVTKNRSSFETIVKHYP